MRKVFILLVIFLNTHTLFGQSVFEFLLPNTSPRIEKNSFDYGYICFNYFNYNLFQLSQADGSDSFIHIKKYSLSSLVNFSYLQIESDFISPDIELYSNLYSNADYLQFDKKSNEYSLSVTGFIQSFFIKGGIFFSESFGGEIGIGFQKFNSTFELNYKKRPFMHAFNYSVKDVSGKIHFDFMSEKKTFKFLNENALLELYASTLSPINTDNRIFTEIEGSLLGMKIWFQYNILSFNFIYDTGEISIYFFDQESPFGKLDAFNFHHYLASLSFQIGKKISIESGITGFQSEIGDESYFEIWPFTYWDIFLASKIRLETLDLHLSMPFTSFKFIYPLKLRNFLFKLRFNVSYHHINFSNNIIYEEKKLIFFPFVSKYESKKIEFNPEIDGIGRIQGRFSFLYKKIEFSVFISQLIPIIFKKTVDIASQTDPSKDEKDKMKKKGGLTLSFSITGYI